MADLTSRLHDALDPLVAQGFLPAYVAVVRHGSDTYEAHGGVRDLVDRDPVGADAVFRIASLSKPVGAVVVLGLIEEGVLGLDDPAARWLPELTDVPVLRTPTSPIDDVVPQRRPITVRHLLTMTSGTGEGVDPTEPVHRALRAAGVPDGSRASRIGAAEYLARLCSVPLRFQPGEGWAYHTSADVLSVLVERAAGRDLSTLVEERVRAPLDLNHLDFHCHAPERLVTSYPSGPSGLGQPEDVEFTFPPPMRSFGAGLLGTAGDYVRFLDDLASGSPAMRLSGRSARAIRSPQVTERQRASAGPFLGSGATYGYLVGITTAPVPRRPGVGSFGWAGGTGVVAACDPTAGITGALFTSRGMSSPAEEPAYAAFWDAVYAQG